MQIVDDEDAMSDQFSASVVGKPTNTRVPIKQVSDEKQIERVAISVIAAWRQGPLTICDVSQRNYFTPTEHHIGGAVYTRDDRNSVIPRSSYNFPLPIMSLFNPIFE